MKGDSETLNPLKKFTAASLYPISENKSHLNLYYEFGKDDGNKLVINSRMKYVYVRIP